MCDVPRPGDISFIRWAELHAPRVRDCQFCGAPTSHYTATCPLHRHLVDISVDTSVDESLDPPSADTYTPPPHGTGT